MKINILNSTCYDYDVFVGKKHCGYVGLNDTICVVSEDRSVNIALVPRDKGSSHIELLSILFGLFFGDSTTTKIYCDYTFNVCKNESDEINVTLKYNNWTPRQQLDFHTVYAVSNNAQITDVNYAMRDFERIKKKHKRLHLFVTSFIPLELLLLVLCILFPQDAVILIAAVFIILFLIAFTFPALKEIRRFKEATEPEYVNSKLTEYAISRRTGSGKVNEDTSRTGKQVRKILNKMFKFDGD